MPKSLLKIGQLVGLVFFVLLGTVTTSSNAMARTVTGQFLNSSVLTYEKAKAAKATDLQTYNENRRQTDTGCEKSCSFSCPPSTCMTGMFSYFGDFGIDARYFYLIPNISQHTDYTSLAVNLFRPPRH